MTAYTASTAICHQPARPEGQGEAEMRLSERGTDQACGQVGARNSGMSPRAVRDCGKDSVTIHGRHSTVPGMEKFPYISAANFTHLFVLFFISLANRSVMFPEEL